MQAIRYPIRQVAYAVPDPLQAARRHAEVFGSGPFFHAPHVPVSDFVHRGKSATFDHSTVLGQWGELMIEFFEQHNPDASHTHDMFPYASGASGLHHVAIIVSDIEEAVKEFETAGFEVASRFTVMASQPFEVIMIDACAAMGHMVEIYADIAPIQGAYAMVREAAATSQDRSQVTTISF
jgi:hypothetical protein